MKKRDFWFGCAYVLVGVGFFLAALLTDTAFTSLFSGLGGGMTGAGIGVIGKYVYWTRPKRREEYAQRLENERIGMKDERLRMLRDRAMGIAFKTGVYILCGSMLLCSVLNAAEVPVTWKAVILYLLGFLLVEFIVYVGAFQKLDKKY